MPVAMPEKPWVDGAVVVKRTVTTSFGGKSDVDQRHEGGSTKTAAP